MKPLSWLAFHVAVLTLTSAALGHAPTRSLLGLKNHRYKDGEVVALYANKVGPLHNPTETYQYYSLPYCRPTGGHRYITEDLGEVLEGDRLVSTPFEIQFRKDEEYHVLCKKALQEKDLNRFRKAVAQDYYVQFFLDDLPGWAYLGKPETYVKDEQEHTKYYLFAHYHLDIAYNEDRVIEWNISTVVKDHQIDITNTNSQVIEFSYSVKWHKTNINFDDRLDRFANPSVQRQHLEIHWFSIINSCVTVVLLTGFLATILLRVLKNDFMKYDRDNELGEEQEETGWKYLHGDVFRFPHEINLFSAMIGVGTQFCVIAIFIFALSLLGVFYPHNRGAMLSACVVLYALTAGIAGYVSGSYYKMFGGERWGLNVMTCALLFCGPLLLNFSFVNTVAIAYGSTAALPFGTIVVIIIMWVGVTLPLTVLGGIAGKNSKGAYQAPCRTMKYPRDIPPLPWYRHTVPQMMMAGFLPFSAIYIELYYIFATVWGHKVYTIYSILFIVFLILLIVTAFITVALTYFQLAVEDHRWWWRSFLCGGATSLFILGYSIYYYHFRSDMNGFMQTSFYFGYNAMVCYAFFMMLGSVGFRAAWLFVHHIYRAIKID